MYFLNTLNLCGTPVVLKNAINQTIPTSLTPQYIANINLEKIADFMPDTGVCW